MSRCGLMHLIGFLGGFVGGAAGSAGLLDKLIELAVYPRDPTMQLLGLLVAGVAAGLAAGVGLAATTGCYSDGY